MVSTRKFRTQAVVGAAAIALLATACGSKSTDNSPSGGGSASAGGALTKVAACSSGQDSTNTFALGSFLPLSGSLAFLAPPAVAGVGDALSEINKDGGVNGKAACLVSQDSSDSDHKAISVANVKKLTQANVSAIVGPESSTVTENVLPVTAPTKTLVFSPAATDDALTGASPWFFRDVAPNFAEGQALGNQILSDVPGAKVGILVFNDAYGLNLRDTLAETIKKGGGSVVYGDKGSGQEFSSTENNFSSIVQDLQAKQPDVVAIIAFDQTAQILPALGSAGFKGNQMYFVDGNLSDYSSTKGVPDLTGSHGTQQGVFPDKTFQDTLNAWAKKNEGKDLGGIFNYAPESYDATMILALASDMAGKFDSPSIQPYVATVTGAKGGKACTTYADCLKLIKGGAKAIHYEGPSKIDPLTKDNQPAGAYVGIYEGQGKNTAAKFLTAIKANIPTK